MRSLTVNAITEKNKIKNLTPINYIKVEFGGAIGTKYYCDRVLSSPVTTENELVISWGSIFSQIREERGSQQSADIAIADVDFVILGYMNNQAIYKIPVTIYQFFSGLILTDAYIIGKGTLREIVRKEDTAAATLLIENYQTNFEKYLGNVASKSTFSEISTDIEGQLLPLIIGRVERATGAIQVIASKRTTLTVRTKWNSVECVVADSKEFSQDTALDLMMGSEYVRGKFVGSKLTLSERGRIIATGKTIATGATINTFIANLAPNGTNWIGKNIKFFIGQQTFIKTITNFTSPNVYAFSPATNTNGIQKDTYFEIYTIQTKHDPGEEIYEYKENYTWIINNAPSTNVEKIEIEGSIFIAGQKAVETFVRLQDSYMTIDTNDATWTASLGHNVTSLTLPFDPKNFQNSPYTNSVLYVTCTGINYENPVDIIVYLAQQLGLTYPDDFDTTSEAAVKALSFLKLGLDIKQKLDFNLLFDIAFQSRISLKFIEGKLYFKYLENALSASVKTITDTEREIDSVEIIEPEEIFNKLYVSYFEDGKAKKFEIKDATSIASYGIREKNVKLWAHKTHWSAYCQAQFLLRRWANPRQKIKFNAFLDQSELQINDVITLDFNNLVDLPVEIETIRYIPGNQDEIDKLEIQALSWKFPGCASSCEAYEQTGCSSSCQQYCTSSAETGDYVCQTANQAACSLICVSVCELDCTSWVENFVGGCTSFCQTGCRSGAETSPAGCFLGCQQNCTTSQQDSACATSCRISCTAGSCTSHSESCSGYCMTSCVTAACQTSCTSQATVCQTGAEGACASSCQGSCTTAGCTVCQSGCQTSTEGCTACCEYTCVSNCRSSCQQGSCRTGCTASVTIDDFSTCQNLCEIGCQAGCEGHCEECCQHDGSETVYNCLTFCQTGCMQNCETAAQTSIGIPDVCLQSCQAYCMSTAAQTGCFYYCTLGCRCSCQSSCVGTSCTTSCEQNCQCTCQTILQTTCSAGNEACYSSCQGHCETSNMTNACAINCQAFCMSEMQTGCNFYCVSGCRCSCQVTCTAAACTSSCEQNCMCLCQTNAETISEMAGCYSYCRTSTQAAIARLCQTSCQATCTTICTGFCQTSNTSAACFSNCQGWCMSEMQTGCNYFCTFGCRCFCQVCCESSCRSGGCEENCQCFCQTAACQTATG